MDSRIKLDEPLELKNSVLLAAWPGMGQVATRAARHLRDKLAVEEVGRILPDNFFRVPGIKVEAGVAGGITLPKSTFYVVRGVRDGGGDLLLFIGDEQPLPGCEYRLAQAVVDVAEHAGVERVYTTAAMVTNLNHKKPSRVWGAATQQALADMLALEKVILLREGYIGGLNGLVLGAAAERGIDGICLLGEIPYYVTEMENPKASRACLEVFFRLTGITAALDDLEQAGILLEERIDLTLRQLREAEDSEEGADGKESGEAEPSGSAADGGGNTPVGGPIN